MMNVKIALLITVLFGSAFCDRGSYTGSSSTPSSSSTLKLSFWTTSNPWWIAVTTVDGASTTSTIEIHDASSSTWRTMSYDSTWGYWQLASSGSSTGYQLPLSFRLTSSNGQQLVLSSLITSINGGAVFDTQTQYGGSQASTQAPTAAPTQAATHAPSQPTQRATSAPTQAAAPTQRATAAPTQAPTQRATAAPTQAPTQRATQKPTTAPSTNLCAITPTSSEPIKLLVPLYIYPGSTWTQVANAAKAGVQTIAIINPNSGPISSGPDSSYTSYMAQLAAAGVVMVGYVHTSYGARSISDVSADIATYANLYPGLSGIFIDEAAASSAELSYYTQVYNAITSHSGYSNVILNPGTQPDEGYLAISTNIVMFEDSASNWKSNFASWVTCAPNAASKAGYKYKFSGIAYASSSSSQMSTVVAGMDAAGFGMVYVTDGLASGNTYNSLPSYFSQEVTAVGSL